MKDRIRQIMEDQKLNQQSFAQLIGKSTATLSNIFNDRTKPTLDIVDAIKKKFPQVNTSVVAFGTPPMYINKVEGGVAASSSGASAGAGGMGAEDSLDMYGGASASAGMGAQAACPGLAAWQAAPWSLRSISGQTDRIPLLLLHRSLISLRCTV